MTPESGETDSPPIEGGEAAAPEKAATKATRAPRARAAKKAADGETRSPRTATAKAPAKKVAKTAKAAPAKAAATKKPAAAAAKKAAELPARKAPARAAAAEAGPAVASIRVTQIRSGIGTKPKHRGTLRALGLRGVGRSNELPNRPEIRGMIARVPHLVKVEEVSS